MKKRKYNCSNCFKEIERYSSTVRNEARVFCCPECGYQYQEEHHKGEKNPNFKHGKYHKPTCECGEPKDHRSKRCAKCAKKSHPKKDPVKKTRKVNPKEFLPIEQVLCENS